MIELLTLFGISALGAVFWLSNAELSAAVYGGQLNWHPLVVGLVCAVGQGVTFSLLYWFGGGLVTRWKWLKVKLDKTQEGFGHRLLEFFGLWCFLGGLVGFPPAIGVVGLASGFGKSYLSSVPLVVAGRFFRFFVIAWLADRLLPYLS